MVLLIFLSGCVSVTESGENSYCGIEDDELDGVALGFYLYQDFEENESIGKDESFIWEYSTNPYCGTEEYEERRDVKMIDRFGDDVSFNRELRRNGVSDECQYQAIALDNSPLDFHSNFERRLYTKRENGKITSWIVLRNRAAMKIVWEGEDEEQTCLEYGA